MAAEKNSTLVMPFPVELLRFVEKATNAMTQSTSDVRIPAARENDDGS